VLETHKQQNLLIKELKEIEKRFADREEESKLCR